MPTEKKSTKAATADRNAPVEKGFSTDKEVPQQQRGEGQPGKMLQGDSLQNINPHDPLKHPRSSLSAPRKLATPTIEISRIISGLYRVEQRLEDQRPPVLSAPQQEES